MGLSEKYFYKIISSIATNFSSWNRVCLYVLALAANEYRAKAHLPFYIFIPDLKVRAAFSNPTSKFVTIHIS